MTVFHGLTAVNQLGDKTEEYDTFRHYYLTGRALYYCNCGWSRTWGPPLTRDAFERLKEEHPSGSPVTE